MIRVTKGLASLADAVADGGRMAAAATQKGVAPVPSGASIEVTRSKLRTNKPDPVSSTTVNATWKITNASRALTELPASR